eukprot:TRINITY_DN1846_c0_g1_i1.p1 TRINITY_DN1846_c0_g1~~TRINITY_DN1846_c0_g1_i1.p1  ORF type:complete len:146 (-),score=44.67 TRINITY_DN1846_c0_g1_i1:116-553(-)
MSTRASASAIVAAPIEKVWAELRQFNFPAKLFSTVESVVLEDNAAPTTVGGVRTVTWKSGEIRKQRLLEVSDIERRAVWETVESVPEAEVSATISTISAKRITESNSTLITWESEFSSDVSGQVIVFEQNAYKQNLDDIKKFFSS